MLSTHRYAIYSLGRIFHLVIQFIFKNQMPGLSSRENIKYVYGYGTPGFHVDL